MKLLPEKTLVKFGKHDTLGSRLIKYGTVRSLEYLIEKIKSEPFYFFQHFIIDDFPYETSPPTQFVTLFRAEKALAPFSDVTLSIYFCADDYVNERTGILIIDKISVLMNRYYIIETLNQSKSFVTVNPITWVTSNLFYLVPKDFVVPTFLPKKVLTEFQG